MRLRANKLLLKYKKKINTDFYLFITSLNLLAKTRINCVRALSSFGNSFAWKWCKLFFLKLNFLVNISTSSFEIRRSMKTSTLIIVLSKVPLICYSLANQIKAFSLLCLQVEQCLFNIHFKMCIEYVWRCSILTYLCVLPAVKCDFQDGLCGLKHDSKLRWSIGSGSTPTKNTGPDYDHSTFLPKGEWFRESI